VGDIESLLPALKDIGGYPRTGLLAIGLRGATRLLPKNAGHAVRDQILLTALADNANRGGC